MLTDLLRDGLFSAAWFGLMTAVWLGWAQEAPPERARPWLGAGSVLGILTALGCGYLVVRSWAEPSALDGRYPLFGVLVAAEVVAAGLGCLVLARRGATRWFSAWVALVVALHFVPLGLMLRDPAMVALGVVQTVALAVVVRWLRGRSTAPSAAVGATMGASLLLFALATAAVVVPRALGG